MVKQKQSDTSAPAPVAPPVPGSPDYEVALSTQVAQSADAGANGAKSKRTDDDKAADFKRLARARMVKALKIIAALGNLANRSSYLFTQEQADRITGDLHNAVEGLKRRFSGKKEVKSEWDF